MKIYTKAGDEGLTSYLGSGKIPKHDIRIEAYGTVDELNSILGVLRHHCLEELSNQILKIQNLLFEIGNELASEKDLRIINQTDILQLEQWIDLATDALPPLTSFILPGGSKGGSWMHIARTVTRRAERRITEFFQTKNNIKTSLSLIYINRLSDLFFTWARFENMKTNVPDIEWQSRSKKS